MATLTVAAAPLRTGIDLTTGSASVGGSGDKFLAPVGDERVAIINGDAAPCTVSIQNNGTSDGQAIPAKTIVIAAGKTFVFGPFLAQYIDTNGFVNLTYSNTTATIKVIAFHA